MSARTRHRRRWRKFHALYRATTRLRDARLLFQRSKGKEDRTQSQKRLERAIRDMKQAQRVA